MAGTVTRKQLDELYISNEVSPEEYVEMLIGSGWSGADAQAALLKAHDDGAPSHWTRPTHKETPLDWSTINRKGRKPTKSPKGGNQTTGHPLEEDE